LSVIRRARYIRTLTHTHIFSSLRSIKPSYYSKYPAGDYKNTPEKLKAFHDRFPGKPGPSIQLPIWLQAAADDEFVDDDKTTTRMMTVTADTGSQAWGPSPVGREDDMTNQDVT
jgi:hypothetical protein